MNERIDLSVFLSEPADEYHAKAQWFLSSHQLIDFMKCPYLYAKKRAGQIEQKESPAFLLGRAAHCRILEGRDEYESQFALGGPINPSTGKPFGNTTKKFLDWQTAQGKPVVSHAQVDLIEAMASGAMMNGIAEVLLQEGRAEGVIRADYLDTPCQIRCDWVHPLYGIADLKTCDDLTWFEADAKKYRYHHQMAFYQSVLHAAIGQYVPIHFIAVEKKEPYRCGVWRLSDDTLQIARSEIEAAVGRLKDAQDQQLWVTGYEEMRVLDIA